MQKDIKIICDYRVSQQSFVKIPNILNNQTHASIAQNNFFFKKDKVIIIESKDGRIERLCYQP